MFQDPYLLLRLPMEPLLIPYHLEGNAGPVPVVVDLDDLSEAALAKHTKDLITVSDVVVWHVDIRTLVVIVAAVV